MSGLILRYLDYDTDGHLFVTGLMGTICPSSQAARFVLLYPPYPILQYYNVKPGHGKTC
jgi:hypothetical protein